MKAPALVEDIRVACNHCEGVGTRLLTYTESTTLAAVPFDWTPTPTVRHRLRDLVTLMALANRLVDLEQLKLVEHRRQASNHRVKEWRRVR